MQITSLGLVRKYQTVCFEVTFLGEVELADTSWFTVLGQMTQFWVCYFFLTRLIASARDNNK